MSILIKGMEMPRGCDDCKLKSNGYCDITNRLIPYDGSRHGDCPLVEVPDEQPDRNAQERYEDLCEYFKDCPDKGMGILGDRKEFKAWLERVHWHVVTCDELGRELEKLQSAQPEQRWIPVTEKLPEDLEEVNVTWINHIPEPYYNFLKDKSFTGSAVYYRGDWYWYSSRCTDILAEYGTNGMDKVDDGIEITAWMPLPEPYGGEQE